VQIHWIHCHDVSNEQREHVEARLRSLSAESDDMIDVRVVGSASNHHRRGGCGIKITCMARGHEIVAAREGDELGAALNEAMEAFERELRRMRERRSEVR